MSQQHVRDDQDPSPGHIERRAHPRRAVTLIGSVRTRDRSFIGCFITDLSESGARLKLLDRVRLRRRDAVLSCIEFGDIMVDVVWQRGEQVGLRFIPAPRTSLV